MDVSRIEENADYDAISTFFRFQEKNLNLNRDSNFGSPDLEIRDSNPGSGSNFSLEI